MPVAPPVQPPKRVAELVAAVTPAGLAGAIASELAGWIVGRRRFEALVRANEDKIRKKLRVAGDADAVADVRAELLVAYRLVSDDRFAVTLEAYGSGVRGPDLTVTFRGSHRVNVEVTRLRPTTRVADACATKMRQLPPSVPNVIALVGAARADGSGVSVVMRGLRRQAERADDEVLARAGVGKTRDFFARYLRISGVAIVSDPADGECDLWLNPEARSPLPRGATVALARCFAGP